MNLIKGDCIEELKNIPEGSIDFLLTDPPYNVSRENNFDTLKGAKRQGMDFGEWDKGADITSWIPLVSKTLKENANVVIFNCWENLESIKKVCEDSYISNAVLCFQKAILHHLTVTECL